MKNKYLFIWFAMMPLVSAAQDNTTDEIEVLKPYQPILADAVKISFSPTIPTTVAEKPTYEYTIPTMLLSISNPTPDLKPVAYSKKNTALLQEKIGYLKLGYGNYNTPYAKLGVHYSLIEKLEIGLMGSYIASKSSKLINQQVAQIDASLFANKTMNNAVLGATLDYASNTVHYYGYDHTLESYPKSAVMQRINNVGMNLTAAGNNTKGEINYDAGLQWIATNTTSGSKELLINLDAKIKKTIFKKHYIAVPLRLATSNYKDSISVGNTAFSIGPQLQFIREKGNLYAGVEVGMVNKKLGIFPYTRAIQNLIKEKLVFETSWSIAWQHNSYTRATKQNPWLADNNNFISTIIQNREIGVNGKMNAITYKLNLNQRLIKNQQLYNNQYTDFRKFDLVYAKLTVLDIGLNVAYKKTERWNVAAGLNIMQYDMDSVAAPWHLPSFEGLVQGEFLVNEKLNIRSSLRCLGGRKAAEGSKIVKLNPIFDLGLEADYKIKENIFAFVQLSNILNQKYQRYNRYEAFGIQAIGGVKFAF